MRKRGKENEKSARQDPTVPYVIQSRSSDRNVPMDNSSYRLIFYLDKKDKIYHYSSKEHPKISKMQSLVAKCCKIRKI